VQFIGRFTADAAGPAFDWSDSTMVGQFTGTGVGVTLQELTPQASYSDGSPGGNIYRVIVDGGQPMVLAARPGTTTYPLAMGLPQGQHTVELRKITEARVGAVRFLGFAPQGGQMVPQAPAPARRLAVIGDSISTGYGDLGTTPYCAFSPSTQDSSQSFGAVAARQVQANLMNTAWAGKGIYRNNDGSTTDTLPQLYGRTVGSDPKSVFDPTTFVPDAIVINLGTNDFNLGVPPENPFEQAYKNFLVGLRATYPNAQILVALGPMLSDTYPAGQQHLSIARRYLQAVVAAVGDPKVQFVEFAQLTSGAQGCDSHPNVSAQQAMGNQLAQVLRSALSW
jgi:lysophospholipase L1-like esterase